MKKIKFTRKKLYGGAGNPEDPILKLNVGHTHPNTPVAEGVPPAGAMAAARLAPAAAEGAPPEPEPA